MGKVNFIKSIIQCGIVSEQDALNALSEQISNISLDDYYNLVSECKKNKIDAASIFKSIYMSVSETIQYQMWKDGYVNSCPADKLINDIVSERHETVKLISVDYGEELPHCEAYFDNIQEIILNHISNAKHSLKIAMAWFTNPLIFNRLLRACNRGVEVTLLINNDLINNRANGLPFNKLIQAGANLYIAEPPKLIHNKFCIIDDQIVIDGSYNWTILAEKNNDENIVVIENGNVIGSFIDAFKQLIRKNEHVESMPARVPERPEYDCCSYTYYNSEEWLEQISEIGSKKKRNELYKEIFKVLPEEIAKEKLPSEVFDVIKAEVEEERSHDDNLFNHSLDRKTEELEKELSEAKKKMDSISQRVETITIQKTSSIDRYKSKVAAIKAKNVSQQQKDVQLNELRRVHRTELNRLNKSLAKHSSQLESLNEESEMIVAQKEFVNSIQDAIMEGSKGLCRINLKWNTADDLDLHLVLPGGTMDSDKDIYYSHMSAEYNGGVCTLDHDAIPEKAGENPQENIFWKHKLPDGQYRILVKLYNKKSDLYTIPFSITALAGKYVKTEVFQFQNAIKGNVIEIAKLTFKNGRVVTPIQFNG